MNVENVLMTIDRLFEENRGEEAETLLRESIAAAAHEGDDEAILQLLNELLGYYREVSRVEDSYVIGDRAIAQAKRMGLTDTVPYATTLLNVANAYRAGGRLVESLGLYRQVEEIYRRILAPDSLLKASFLNNLALLHQEMGNHGEARKCLLEALPVVHDKEERYKVAVTYTNLANSCISLALTQEALEYTQRAIGLFEQEGAVDSHYAAALAAKANIFYQEEKYEEAAKLFGQAAELMEQSLGRNDFYYRLCDNYESCIALSKNKGDRAVPGRKGLDISESYYLEYGAPMIHRLFPEYEKEIAVGLVGEGSDCFGYDDETSRDHDWGPGFCLWLTQETYEKIGPALQRAYEELPGEYLGYTVPKSEQIGQRRGVHTIDSFFMRLVGAHRYEDVSWAQVNDAGLAAVCNGKIFRDDLGEFTARRSAFAKGYPERVCYLKLADAFARFSQAGQYNYGRTLERGDELTASIMLADGVREAMKALHYIENRYPIHDKWLRKSLEKTEDGQKLKDLLQAIPGASKAQIMEMVEEIGAFLAMAAYRRDVISDTESYLDVHTRELVCKAEHAELTVEDLAMEIARLEFKAFDQVQNEGGRAECQNNWPTFQIMRRSQYLTWDKTMLLQYLYDFETEFEKGHNLITEKYGRMMESTAPEKYRDLERHFPVLSEEKKAIIEQIVGIQVGWMEEFSHEYPALADNARSIHTAEDHLWNTSYETYLRGEISTYSDKMLELYGRYIVRHVTEGKNLAYEIMTNNVHLYGYQSLEKAESFLK